MIKSIKVTIKKNFLSKAIKELNRKKLTYKINWSELLQEYIIEITKF
jgi:hypothetical protein